MKLSKVIDLLRGPRKRGEAARLMGAHPCSLAKWDRECIVVDGVVYRRTGLQLPPIDTQLQAERLAAVAAVAGDGCTVGEHTARALAFRSPEEWLQNDAAQLTEGDFNRYYLGLDIDGSTRLTGAEWLAVLK